MRAGAPKGKNWKNFVGYMYRYADTGIKLTYNDNFHSICSVTLTKNFTWGQTYDLGGVPPDFPLEPPLPTLLYPYVRRAISSRGCRRRGMRPLSLNSTGPWDRHQQRHGHPRAEVVPVKLATSRTRTTILVDLSADSTDTRAFPRNVVR